MKKKKVLYFFVFLALGLIFAKKAMAQDAGFNPNYIISDEEVTNSAAMTAQEIQSFLEGKNSFLAAYTCQDPDGNSWRASQAIFNLATTNKVSPRFLLVLLQKEQSLIEDITPEQSQLDWATGYGCPDGGGCNERWRGFWKQVNSASLQFRDYLDNPQLYKYQAGQAYSFTNPYGTINREPMTVTPANRGTAALYNYTPHVYNGNYNFWKIWHRYFSQTYPNGSLLRIKGEIGVWLLQDGKKRPFISKGALISRFDPKKIIDVNKADLDVYLEGAPIKFPQYAIIRSPRGGLFLLVDNQRRGFANMAAFKKIGYNPEEIINAEWDDINTYQEGKPITVDDAYPTGALLQDKKTGGVYWVAGGVKAPLTDPLFLKTKFKKKKIIRVASGALDKYQTVTPVRFDDGDLLKLEGGFAVYVAEGLSLRPINSAQTFEDLGYQWSNIITVPQNIFYLYIIGEPLKSPGTAS